MKTDEPWSISAGSRAFTLMELLTVIAVIAILAAVLIPTISSARFAASRTRTRVQFSQWASACETFRQEYGYYPTLDGTAKVNGGATTAAAGLHVFHDVLVGHRRDGSALPPASGSASAEIPVAPEAQNFRRITFLTFTENEIYADAYSENDKRNLVHDAFDNTDIAVLVDRNLDGKIDSADYATLPGVSPPEDSAVILRPAESDFPVGGVRAGVLFYCAPPKADSAARLILSWK